MEIDLEPENKMSLPRCCHINIMFFSTKRNTLQDSVANE